MKPWLPVACLAAVTMISSLSGAAEWTASWGAAPLPPSPAVGPFPATPTFSNQTIRQFVRLTAGGGQIRVRFTNEYGSKPLLIGAARVALADARGAVLAGTSRALSFTGKSSVLIPAGAPFLSDPLKFPVKALSNLSLSIYLPEDTGQCTCHATGMQTAYISDTGNLVSEDFVSGRTSQARAFISGVEVADTVRTKAVVVLGDSISDGMGSTPDRNRRWPDLFAQRLLAAGHGRQSWSVVNMGISGNRLLNDGVGQSALARFDRDVLSVPGIAYLIVFEGVNDIGISFGHFQGPMADIFERLVPQQKASVESMIAAYRQLIERAHAKGIKIFGATLTPYEGSVYYSQEGESARQQINAWIRNGGGFDAVLDFDAILRDPDDPTTIATPLQTGDHLHGSDQGYEALAKSINLSLFR